MALVVMAGNNVENVQARCSDYNTNNMKDCTYEKCEAICSKIPPPGPGLIFATLQVLVFASNAFPYDLERAAIYNVLDFGAVGDNGSDDTKALRDAWRSACKSRGAATVVVPRGKTFLVKPIEFDGSRCKFSSVRFQIKGSIVAPRSKGWANCKLQWLSFINIRGLTIDGYGLIDGNGEIYWAEHKRKTKAYIQEDGVSYDDDDEDNDDDTLSINGSTDDCNRAPSAMLIESCSNVKINGLNSKDSPGVHISIKKSTNVHISNVWITAPDESPNTDGINIRSSQRVTIKNSKIGTGDDCIAINDGSRVFNISNVACGPGHGISVGSLGKNGGRETVEDVYVKDCSFTGTTNGARIKTWQGGSGYARRITFERITLRNTRNPIFIDQNYCPHNICSKQANSAVDISDVSFINFHGTSASQESILLNCVQGRGCTDIVLKNINIRTTDRHRPARAVCANAHGKQIKTSPRVSCIRSSSSSAWSLASLFPRLYN
ncbi:unnamed protein product [Rhodiola kirilowii]